MLIGPVTSEGYLEVACIQPKSGSSVTHHYVFETTCGVTPENPVWSPLRFTSGNLQQTRDTLVSTELDGGRDIASVRLGSKQSGGEISIELSVTSYDDILEATLGGTWVVRPGEAGLSIAVAAAGKTFTRAAGDFTTAPTSIIVGDMVQFPSLTGGNAGTFRVTAVNATIITCSGIAAGILVDESTVTTDIKVADTLPVGNIRRTMSILSNFPDSDGTADYQLVTGVEVTGFSFDISVNALVTGSLPILGRDLSLLGATVPAGSTFNSVITTEPFSGLDGRILQDGVIIGFFTSIGINNDNAQSAQFELGAQGTAFLEKGRANNTLSISTFFSSTTLLEKFLNESVVQLTAILAGIDGSLMFDFPTVKYTSGSPEVEGETSIVQNLEAQATGSIGNSSLIIRRIV